MSTQDNAVSPTPLRLHAEGNKVVDSTGKDIILRGVSIADPFFLADENLSNHFCESDFYVLSKHWNVNVIRVPVHPELWEQDRQYMQKFLDPVVAWGEKYGLYLLLDWHAHGNPVTGRAERTGRENIYPWKGNPYNPDLELARSALSALAERYGEKSWVLYECFNEPAYISWSDWRTVAQELVDTIQAAAPEAVVVVSGTDWGYDLSGALADPVARDDIIYATHAYPGKGNKWKDVLRRLKEVSPVIIGEWGFRENCCNSNLNATAENYALPLLMFANDTGIGWIAWVWHPFWEPPMILSWDEYQPTEFGLIVKQALGGG